jgi:hypothetical protein
MSCRLRGIDTCWDHAREFEQLGIPPEKLAELAEAATTVGYPGREQKGGKNRPG